ncbi:MAG: hypothetical protein C4334_11705 [Pyrinomonas sp.]
MAPSHPFAKRCCHRRKSLAEAASFQTRNALQSTKQSAIVSAASQGMKLYCNRYSHFKDPLVCAVSCPFRARCRDFALFYAANREAVEARLCGYLDLRRERSPEQVPSPVGGKIVLEVKRSMPEAMYIWIDADERAELVSHQEALRRAERGAKPKQIYKVAQEMELRYQLVPRRRIEKVKREVATEEARAAARRARLRAVETTDAAPTEETPKAAPKRRRAK